MSYSHIEHHPECALRRVIEQSRLGCPECISFDSAGNHGLVVTSVPQRLGHAVLSWTDVYACIDADCAGAWVSKRLGQVTNSNASQSGVIQQAKLRLYADSQKLSPPPCTCAEVRE